MPVSTLSVAYTLLRELKDNYILEFSGRENHSLEVELRCRGQPVRDVVSLSLTVPSQGQAAQSARQSHSQGRHLIIQIHAFSEAPSIRAGTLFELQRSAE